MQHKIFFYEKNSDSKLADRLECIGAEEYPDAQQAHKRFTAAVQASLCPASPMRITWTGTNGNIMADYFVRKPI